MEEDEGVCVVMDIGSLWIKSGISGDDAPRSVMLNVVGRRADEMRVGGNAMFMGLRGGENPNHDHFKTQTRANLTWPMVRGQVRESADLAEVLCAATTLELELDITDIKTLLLTEPPCCAPEDRERLIRLAFGNFPQLRQVGLANTATLSWVGAGGTTICTVLECGDAVCHVVPIIDSQVFPDAAMRLEIGGQDLTQRLGMLLSSRHGWDTEKERRMSVYFRHCKEKFGFVAQRPKTIDTTSPRTYDDLDAGDDPFTLEEERFLCAEALFDPSLVGVDGMGVHELVHTCISSCPAANQKDLYSNIICSGGSAGFLGFAERLEYEVAQLAPQETVGVKKIHPVECLHNAWIGASIFSSLTPGYNWITKEEYETSGAGIVHSRRHYLGIDGVLVEPAPFPLPQVVAMLRMQSSLAGHMTFSCTNLAGLELFEPALEIDPERTLSELRMLIAERLPGKRLRLVQSNGRLLTVDDDGVSLGALFE